MIFDSYSGEHIGMQLAQLQAVRADPYNLPSMDDMPGVSSVAFLPFKLSLYSQALQSAWYGAGSVGSVTSRFSPNRLKWRYRATTVNGLIGNSLRSVQEGVTRFYRGNAFTFSKWKTVKQTAKGVTGPRDLKNAFVSLWQQRGVLRPQTYKEKVQPWKIIHDDKAETAFMHAKGTWSSGFLDKLYLSPANVKQQLSVLVDKGALTKELYESLTDDTLFTKELAKELYGESLGKKAASQGKIDIIERAVWGVDARQRNRKFYKNYYKQTVLKNGTVSLWDIIKGEGDGTFWERRKGFFTGPQSVRFTRNMEGARSFSLAKFTFPWNTGKYGKVHGRTAEAALRVLRDQGVDSIASTALREASHNIATTVVSRMRMAKVLRGAGIIAYAIPAVLQAGMGMYNMINEVNSRMATTIHQLSSSEFGGGQVLDNARIATERQRAVQAIQSAHMNARYLLGSEASLYH